MATLILSTIGQALGGPIGAAIGTLAGSVIDRKLLGGRGRGEGARLTDLSVQGAGYGWPLPLVYGTARVAGTLIWSTGLIETRATQSVGSGKRATKVDGYAYSASFALGLSARPLRSLGRIWADGKLIKEASGPLSVSGSWRLLTGDERQTLDPAIEAALGVDMAPAMRGLAAVVFENLALADFGNRLPNLTVEVEADPPGGISLGAIARDVAERAGVRGARLSGATPYVTGAVISGDGAARQALSDLHEGAAFAPIDDVNGVILAMPTTTAKRVLSADVLGARASDSPDPRAYERQRSDAQSLPRQLELSHVDPAADYQTSVQQAWTVHGERAARVALDLPLVMQADLARQIAATALARRWRGREALSVRLPIDQLDLRAGEVIALAQDPSALWRISERVLEEGGLTLSLEPVPPMLLPAPGPGDGGGDGGQQLQPQGPTTLHLLDLPVVEASAPSAPRLYAAVSGSDDAWRQAALWLSADAGVSYEAWGTLSAAAVMGSALTTLAAAPSAALWDERSTVEIALLNPAVDLVSRSRAAVLDGANLLLLGDELLQFAQAEPLSTPGHWRLRSLLRGRRGTEAAMAGHAVGERALLIEPGVFARVDTPPVWLGRTLLGKAVGATEALSTVNASSCAFAGGGLRPLSPAHLRLRRAANGDVTLSWVRRSRQGFAWLDGADAPLAEDAELYAVNLWSGPTLKRAWSLATPQVSYPLSQQTADWGGPLPTGARFEVMQMSAVVGPGAAAALLV
jgi:hypothetical protein